MNPFILGQITLFTFITIVSFFFVYKRAKAIYRNIKLGRKEIISDRKGIRFKIMLLIAFGQQKMFKNPLVAILHFTIYVAFIINIPKEFKQPVIQLFIYRFFIRTSVHYICFVKQCKIKLCLNII